jgi:AcrR family transcriptional regulator
VAGLRETKRERTRQALVEAGARLFAERGYQKTRVADIAAAADISTRSFFSYFASKEDLLYPESDRRIRAGLDAIADRQPGEKPPQVLLRALREVAAVSDELVGPMAALRVQLATTEPTVGRRGLQEQQRAQLQLAGALVEAYGDDLDPVYAATLVGAFMGGVAGAVGALMSDPQRRPEDPEDLYRQLNAAIEEVLSPILQ